MSTTAYQTLAASTIASELPPVSTTAYQTPAVSTIASQPPPPVSTTAYQTRVLSTTASQPQPPASTTAYRTLEVSTTASQPQPPVSTTAYQTLAVSTTASQPPPPVSTTAYQTQAMPTTAAYHMPAVSISRSLPPEFYPASTPNGVNMANKNGAETTMVFSNKDWPLSSLGCSSQQQERETAVVSGLPPVGGKHFVRRKNSNSTDLSPAGNWPFWNPQPYSTTWNDGGGLNGDNSKGPPPAVGARGRGGKPWKRRGSSASSSQSQRGTTRAEEGGARRKSSYPAADANRAQ